jgi:hypothetical protein
MPHDTRDLRADSATPLASWGSPVADADGPLEETAIWVTGGATLLAWTALALLLTAA